MGGLALPLVSPAETGRTNRARLLRILYAHGPLSRSELAQLSGSQRSVVGIVVQPLIDEGILREGLRASGPVGGRPARPLWFVDEGSPIGAVHVMSDHIRAAIVGIGGKLLATGGAPLVLDGPEGVVDQIGQVLQPMIAASPSPLRGVGVAVGGMVDTRTGTIVHVDLAPQMDGLALGPRLAGLLDIPVVVDLHPRAQALGDLWFGSARDLSSFASVYCREAIGVGLVVDGAVHRGQGGGGGELGHTIVDLDGAKCLCGRTGCWDTIATTRWLRSRAAVLSVPGAAQLTGKRLGHLASLDDPSAIQLLQEYAFNLAIGLSTLYQLMAPEAVVLHGDPAEAGEVLGEAVRDALEGLVAAHPAFSPTVILASSDDTATLRGAACLVLAEMLRLSI